MSPSPLTRFDPEFRPLDLPEVILVRPKQIEDGRGLFRESYVEAVFQAGGVAARFVQDNVSVSAKAGTVRGLHFQRPPHGQTKLVQCLAGAALDVAVDLRAGSPTYGEHVAALLTARGGEQLYVPEGFAHGFCTMEDDTVIAYKVSAPYHGPSDAGVAWDDPALGIDWPVAPGAAVLSDKDKAQPDFEGFQSPFVFGQ